MADSEVLKTEYEIFLKDLAKAEKEHDEYLHLYKETTRRQDASAKNLKHLFYCYKRFRGDVKRLESKKEKTSEEVQMLAGMKSKLAEVSAKLSEMERELPAKDIGPYLSIILGSNLNISLLNPDDRYKYKQEYESFKLTVTYVILGMFTLAYFVPFRAVDALCNFLLVWYYCTLTIRESILRVNGSRIKGWWVLHHYISCVLCGITLTWRDGTCYKEFRTLFILLACYIGSVQLLQTKYQTGCLRRLHALGQRHSMDISTEGFSSFMFKGLTFLLPFLIGGYMIQGYCSYTLFLMYMRNCKDWQVIVLAVLFAVITFGNIVITSLLAISYRKTAISEFFNGMFVGASELFMPNEEHKEPRGTYDYQIDPSTGILAISWNDNRPVTILTTVDQIEPIRQVNRWSAQEKKKVQISQPNTKAAYNKYMGGVDRMDQNINNYRVSINSKKWWFSCFSFVLHSSIHNA